MALQVDFTAFADYNAESQVWTFVKVVRTKSDGISCSASVSLYSHDANHTMSSFHRAYNDTILNCFNVLSRIALFESFSPNHFPSNIIYLSPTRLVKFGHTVNLAEASALRLVAASTSVPVPKVHCAFRNEKSGQVIYCDGED